MPPPELPTAAPPPDPVASGALPADLAALLPQVYDELRRLAASYLRGERPDHTLQPTALVHEAYLRLLGQREIRWADRAHLLGFAARTMRCILANHAASRATEKRGGGAARVSLDEAVHLWDEQGVSLTLLDDALRGLEALDPRQGQIVELRFFGGLTVEETASVLDVSPATIKREWTAAKRWLQRELDRTR